MRIDLLRRLIPQPLPHRPLPHRPLPHRRLGPVLLVSMLFLGSMPGQAAEPPSTVTAAERPSAVILMYHRFGEDGLSSTNIRLDQFEAQIAELKTGNYTILPLPKIVAALQAGTKLPDRTIAITVDDGFLSVYKEAMPRLKEAGFPFTIFISTDAIDTGYRDFMSWDQVRELVASGVTIGAHTASHLHMADATTEKNLTDIQRSNRRFEEELGFVPELFAYPFGEAGSQVEAIASKSGYISAFGQHSSVAYWGSDFYNLPRFSLNERYGTIDRFRRIINSLPLPVTEKLPVNTTMNTAWPIVGFTVDEGIEGINQIACYPSNGGEAVLENLGNRRIEVRYVSELPLGRSRLNCTMPAQDGRWRWLGYLFYYRQP